MPVVCNDEQQCAGASVAGLAEGELCAGFALTVIGCLLLMLPAVGTAQHAVSCQLTAAACVALQHHPAAAHPCNPEA
jgi:hypothetical protein